VVRKNTVEQGATCDGGYQASQKKSRAEKAGSTGVVSVWLLPQDPINFGLNH
jgi:hypothetical protein